jgi:hypothetical protein
LGILAASDVTPLDSSKDLVQAYLADGYKTLKVSGGEMGLVIMT